MLIPMSVDVPMTRLPVANWLLIGLIACTSIVGWYNADVFDAMAGIDRPADGETEIRIPARIREAYGIQIRPVFNPPLWQWPVVAITSSFLHIDVAHLIGNLIFLWVFGNAINYKFGHLGFLGLYLAGAMFAGLASYIANPGVGGVGASGAIMCVMGAFLVFFPRNDVAMTFSIWFIPLDANDPYRVSSWIVMLAWVAMNVLGKLFLPETEVGWTCHLAGFTAGFVIAWLLAWWEIVEPTRYEQTLLQVLGIRA